MTERDKPTSEFWVHCGQCGHAWVLAYLPMEVDAVARLAMAARCPYGHQAKVYWGSGKTNEGN